MEHFTDGIDGQRGGAHRMESEETLTDGTSNGDDDDYPNYWFEMQRLMREPLAEWFGTMVAVLIGTCGNLQVKTSNGEARSFSQEAALWGLSTMMAIYIAGGVSGAHLSVFLCVFRGFPFRKVVIYVLAPCLGAFCAVWIAFGIYKDAIMDFDPGKTSTSKGTGTAFFTFPQPFAAPSSAFFTDFMSAAVMGGFTLAIGDDTNAPPGAGMHALIIGLVGFARASAFGYNTGHQTNPAKDLASRLVPFFVGYGDTMWRQGWWAEAWSAAIEGGLFGCLTYDVAIFEGDESPINYPMAKRRKAAKGTRGKWLKTGLFGKEKKRGAKEDLENGEIGVMEKGKGHDLTGHGS